MNPLEIAQTRYTTKAFNPNQKIPQAQFNELLEILRLSPSSVNIQPWHFFIASTTSAKEKIAEAMQDDYSYNAQKVLDSSHTLVFCARTDIDEEYLNLLLEQDEKAGRFKDEKAKITAHHTRSSYVNYYRNTRKNLDEWLKNQTYLALGQLLFSAKAKDIDATPMEGFDYQKLDTLLSLKDKQLTSVVVVALGYHSENDFNAKLPKARLTTKQIFTEI